MPCLFMLTGRYHCGMTLVHHNSVGCYNVAIGCMVPVPIGTSLAPTMQITAVRACHENESLAS